jgi:hypothetical protein
MTSRNFMARKPKEHDIDRSADTIFLLSGIPATGKSTYARYLARKHNFAHYDMEVYPSGWPRPGLKPYWDSSHSLCRTTSPGP